MIYSVSIGTNKILAHPCASNTRGNSSLYIAHKPSFSPSDGGQASHPNSPRNKSNKPAGWTAARPFSLTTSLSPLLFMPLLSPISILSSSLSSPLSLSSSPPLLILTNPVLPHVKKKFSACVSLSASWPGLRYPSLPVTVSTKRLALGRPLRAFFYYTTLVYMVNSMSNLPNQINRWEEMA